jgi:hypothetical protein
MRPQDVMDFLRAHPGASLAALVAVLLSAPVLLFSLLLFSPVLVPTAGLALVRLHMRAPPIPR